MTIPASLTRRELTPMQRVVLAALCASKNASGRVVARQVEIARTLGIHDSALRSALTSLTAHGLITIERRSTKKTPQIIRVNAH